MSDSKPPRNSKKQPSPKLTYQYVEWREVGRADEYPLEADGSQTISELCREYNHIVDDLKSWPYFDIRGCLERLPWSVDECYSRILPQWIENSSLTRHAVVQLALYACDPFRDVPPDLACLTCVSRDSTPSRPPGGPYFNRALPDGYYFRAEPVGHLIDQYLDKSNNQKQRKYPCPAVVPLIEALATALMQYELWCEYCDGWRHFEEQRDIAIRSLESTEALFDALRRRDIPPEEPTLKHDRKLQKDLQRSIDILKAITREDYKHAGGQTDTPSDPRAHGNKYTLLMAMDNAFAAYGPAKWTREATYRALTEILNQMQILNAERKQWSPIAIKGFLRRGPDPRLRFTINVTRPNVEPWYTRPG